MAYKYKHVIMAGIDGAGVFFHKAKAPLIRSMFEKGAGADPALTVFPTESAQCWCTMLTGIMPEEHGLTMENIGEIEYKGKAYRQVILAWLSACIRYTSLQPELRNELTQYSKSIQRRYWWKKILPVQ